MNKKLFALLFILPSFSVAASSYSGSGELGFTVASGNSDTKTLNANLSVEIDLSDDWKHSASFSLLNSSTSGITSAEKYEFNYFVNYAETNNPYYYSALNMRKDRFSGIKLSTGITFGLGYKFNTNSDSTLTTLGGFGIRKTEDMSGESVSEGVVTASAIYSNSLSKTTDFLFNINIESGESNTFTKIDTGLRVSVQKTLSLKYNVSIQNNSSVSSNVKNTDVVQTINLVYGF